MNVGCILNKGCSIKTSKGIKIQGKVQKQMWPELKLYWDEVCGNAVKAHDDL